MIKTTPAPVRRKASSLVRDEVAAVRELEARLRETRRATIRQRTATALFCLAAATTLALIGIALADYYWELPTALRAACLAAIAAAVAVVSARGHRRWIAPYTLSRAAADAERQVREFGQRLRTTLDYEQETPRPAAASSTLLTALHHDTHQVARKANWEEVVDSRPAFVACAGAAFVFLGWLVALVAVPEFRVSSGRALLLPWDYTTVTFEPQTKTVRVGESVEIRAEVAGRPISSAVLRYRDAGSKDEWTSLELLPVTGDDGKSDGLGASPAGAESAADGQPSKPMLHGLLAVTLADLENDVEFEVLAGPRPLPPGSITVLKPLTLEKSAARIVPPEYTAREPETVETLDFKVLEGSTVELRLELNRPAAEARLTQNGGGASGGAPAEIPLAIEGNVLHVTLTDLPKSAAFTLSAQAADGMALDPVQVNIRVQLDRKPEIRFIQPTEELTVNPIAEVAIVVEAEDDISLQKVGVMYQIGSGEMQTLVEQDAEGSAEPLTVSSTLMLEQFDLSFKDAVTYYAFAEDNYFGQTRRTTTRLRFIDIRPYRVEFKKVEGEGSCNGCSTTLEELIARQRQNLTLAFAAQEQGSLDSALAERLAEGEQALLEQTREFQEGMEARGAVLPALTVACDEMQDALDALAEKNLPDAVRSEQAALASLILARQNVRKLLNQSNSQSAQACRKFDRDQKQKLRMPEKKNDRQQELAQARSQLSDLARREREWSQQCQSCSSSSSKGSQSASRSAAQPRETSPQQGDPNSQKSDEQPQDGDKPDGNKPDGDKQADSSEPPSRAEVAGAQRKIRDELAALREKIDKLGAAGKAAGNQAQEADRSMQKGLDEFERENDADASREGERAARELEQLADHLAAMNSRDFGQRLDQAGKLARQLADRQARLEAGLNEGEKQSGASAEREGSNGARRPEAAAGRDKDAKSARDERELAAEAGLLAEQLEALERDAAAEQVAVHRQLREANSDNPPGDIAAIMRQAADELDAKRRAQGARGVGHARQRLDDLARTVAAIRGEYAQPQLDELLALEEQLAKLLEEARRTGDASAARQKWEQLQEKLDRFAQGDKRLEKALRALRDGRPGDEDADESDAAPEKVESGQTTAGKKPPKPGSKLRPAPHVADGGREMPQGHYSWLELGDFSGLLGISKVLQTRIQEAILAGALIDADQPVPAQYKDLVEKYYRALSDDLR